jgi:site-specific recombinase XerD
VHIDQYAALLIERGYTRGSIKQVLRDGKQFVEWGRSKGLSSHELDDGAVARFAARNRRRSLSRRQRSQFRTNAQHMVAFLRGCGIVPPAAPVMPPPLTSRFEEWMRDHRGCAPGTIGLYVFILERKLLPLLAGEDDAVHFDAHSWRSAVVKCASGWSPAHAASIVSAARAFLRFMASEGKCTMELVYAIPKPAQWRLASMPRHVAVVDVERIIASCDRSTGMGRRDRAVLLLLARLALRADDVAHLTFDAIDWRGGRVRVAGKTRREDWLPLPQDAGDAILAYLKDGRPKRDCTRVFLSSRAPFGPLSRGRVSTLVACAIARAGVDAPVRGAHLLRHSAAVAMLNGGLGLEQIAAVLRHASLETTSIYAKVDKPLLTLVTAPWPRASRLQPGDHDIAEADLQHIAAAWPAVTPEQP